MQHDTINPKGETVGKKNCHYRTWEKITSVNVLV